MATKWFPPPAASSGWRPAPICKPPELGWKTTVKIGAPSQREDSTGRVHHGQQGRRLVYSKVIDAISGKRRSKAEKDPMKAEV